MLLVIDLFLTAYYAAALAMSLALTRHYPEYHGWQNVQRSLGWPVTFYELMK